MHESANPLLPKLNVFKDPPVNRAKTKKADSRKNFHLCVPIEGHSCLKKSSFICPPDFYDGCLTSETQVHMCLPLERGISCAEKVHINCPDYFEDGCFSGTTAWHLCQPRPIRPCGELKKLNCPPGFMDSCLSL